MTLRKKVTLWTVAVCLVTFAVWAANPSFSSFQNTQFDVSGNVVKVKQQANITNTTFVTAGGNPAATLRDYLGAGPIFQIIDQNATTAFLVDLDDTTTIQGALLANTSVYTPSTSFSTNPITSNSALNVAQDRALTNMTGNLTFTGIANSSSTRVMHTTLYLDSNGSDRTLTLPANWKVTDAIRTITVTNGVLGMLSVEVYANKYTNAVYKAFF